MKKILMIISIVCTATVADCQIIDINTHIKQFYSDATLRGIVLPEKTFITEVKDLTALRANGRIDRIGSDTLRIVIDEVFHDYFVNSAGLQVKRLVYYLLARELLLLPPTKHGIMNSGEVYRRLASKDLEKIFSSYGNIHDRSTPARNERRWVSN